MFNSKYSNILTMILVVLIVAILGIIGYFGYDMMTTSAINSNAQSVLEEFENSTKTVTRDTSKNIASKPENNEVSEEIVANPLDSLNIVKQETTTQSSQNKDPEKVYMEDYEVKGRIQIPKTKVDYPVLDKVTIRSLEMAVAIAYGPGLNEVGNTIIYGHNYRNGAFFSNNKKLTNGDKIYITDQYGQTVTYVIYNIYETTANDAEYMRRDTEGRREISLQTCTDTGNGRIIIWAAEQV